MKKVEKIMNFWGIYYPIILAFISFLFSVTLWFTGNQLEGIFVGIWVPSILSASVAIRSRRSVTFKTDKYFEARNKELVKATKKNTKKGTKK